MPLLFMILICFCVEILGVALMASSFMPLVLSGYFAYLVQYSISPVVHSIVWIFIIMSMMVHGASPAVVFLYGGAVAIALMQYRAILHESFLVYSGVTMVLVVGGMLVMGTFEWTILNVFGTLVIVPILVKYGV